MNEVLWREALKLSRFKEDSKEVHAKVLPVIDYVIRLESYQEGAPTLKESLILSEGQLREDKVRGSLSPSILKTLSHSFVDNYFSVPKVLEGEGGKVDPS